MLSTAPRRLAAAAILLALLFHAPSVWLGFLADDFGMQLVLEGRVESPSWKPWSLYDFGTYAEAPARAHEGSAFPWWIDHDWRVRFLRPVTSLSLWLDHAVFGPNALPGHLVNLGIFALALIAALRLYLRLGLSHGTALLAILVFAFDNGAQMPVGWLANRNSLLEALFAVLALDQALRAKESPTLARLAGALLLAVLAVGAKESGVHVLGLLAVVFFFARVPDARRRRLQLAAVAAVGLTALYLAFYVSQGYGANVLFYPTPWGAPAEFAKRTLAMLASTPIAAATPFPIDALAIHPERFGAILAAALLLGAPIAWLVSRRLRAEPQAGLLFLWGLLALLPQAGAPPSDRLMFTPMLAWAPLLALYLTRVLSAAARAGVPVFERVLARMVAGCSLVLSPLLLFALGMSLIGGAETLRRVIRDADVGPEALGERHAFVMQASPSALVTLGPLSAWLFLGGSESVRFHPLQSGPRALRWTRLDEKSFAVETGDEPFLSHPFESVFLTRELRPGEARTWNHGPFTVRGETDAAGALRRLEFECASDLDEERWRFLVFDGTRLVHRPPPEPGETIVLERGIKDPLLP